MKATLCSLGLLSPLLLSAYAAPVFEKRQTTGPGSPYACASQYNTPAMKTSLIDQGADARGMNTLSTLMDVLYYLPSLRSTTDIALNYRSGHHYLRDVSNPVD